MPGRAWASLPGSSVQVFTPPAEGGCRSAPCSRPRCRPRLAPVRPERTRPACWGRGRGREPTRRERPPRPAPADPRHPRRRWRKRGHRPDPHGAAAGR